MRNKAGSKKFTVILSDEDRDNLFKVAENMNISVSKFVRSAVYERLEKRGYVIEEI